MLALDRLAPGPEWIPQTGIWVALGLVGGGVALHAWAWRSLRRAGGPIGEVAAPPRLVTGGPYGLSRNPMYLAGILILAGLAGVLGSVTPFLGVMAFGWIVGSRIVRAEEALLEAELGEEYDAYRARVRRWI